IDVMSHRWQLRSLFQLEIDFAGGIAKPTKIADSAECKRTPVLPSSQIQPPIDLSRGDWSEIAAPLIPIELAPVFCAGRVCSSEGIRIFRYNRRTEIVGGNV